MRETPTIGMDYCFPEGRGRDDGGEHGQDRHPQTVLLARESFGGTTLAMQVPRKGAAHRGVVKYLAQWIKGLGYPTVILKGDPEPSIKQLQDELRRTNEDVITVPENSPTGDSASNGLAERAIEEVEGYLRTLRLGLEERVGIKIAGEMLLMQ